MNTNPVLGPRAQVVICRPKMGSAQRTPLSARTGSSLGTSQSPMVIRSREGGQKEFLANPLSLLELRVYPLFQDSAPSSSFICIFKRKMTNKHKHYRIQTDLTFRLLTSGEETGGSGKFLSDQHLTKHL